MRAGGGGKRPRHGQFNKNFSWRKTPEKFFVYRCSFGICVIQIIVGFDAEKTVSMEKNIPKSESAKFMESKLDIFE